MLNGVIRATAILGWAVWLSMMPAKAEECRIGPVTVDAPHCDIKEAGHFEGPAQYASWEEGGICASPVSFIVRAVRLKRHVVELHVDRTRTGRAAHEPAFIALLDRVKLSAAN